MLAREDIAELFDLILDRTDVDERWMAGLRQQPTLRHAALHMLESRQFVHLHQLDLALAFGVRPEIEPYL